MNDTADVVIAGFGPAGAMLASLLGQRGHRIVVFEKFPEPYGLPRMSTLDGEVARLLQHAADPAEALAESLPVRSVELWGSDGRQKGRFDWDYKRAGHWGHMALHQPHIEAAMEQRIATLPAVEVHWGTSVVGLRAEGGGYVVTTSGGDSVSARYVVGMDGVSGFVRDAVGIDVEVVHRHHDRWILTDYDVVKPLPHDLEHRCYFDLDFDQPYFWGPNGVGRVRSDVRLLPGDDEEVVAAEERGLEFLERRVGIPRDHVRQTRRKLYTFRSQIAVSMRRGGVFIGGDSAHGMTPYMGQGACTAMRDAANLAWKLDLVLRGLAQEALLDTYEAERLAHARFFVEGSLAAYKMINPFTPEDAAGRDAYLEATGGDVTPPIPPLRHGIQHRSADGEYGEQAGEVAPQGVVRIGEREGLLDDLVGYGFQLISTLPLEEILGAARLARLADLGVRVIHLGDEGVGGVGGVVDVEGTYADYLAEHHATTLLSRPDVYLFGLADGADDAVALVDDLLAQIPEPAPVPA
ncbi:FAD-dependent monooxygenase [Pseudonocardia kujensis]|uniref:FAD-dependent monooxygenase n=1 Tax=Pseudonocardia kujensis TaxID=1128675 RepID=UPI001E36CB8D|nr:FAD-dependent monooxygenase [Pseudonocardia kujensis]MCE0763341.1 FAD-dependent monooxygenase [Pseudonocardia kujensis]